MLCDLCYRCGIEWPAMHAMEIGRVLLAAQMLSVIRFPTAKLNEAHQEITASKILTERGALTSPIVVPSSATMKLSDSATPNICNNFILFI